VLNINAVWAGPHPVLSHATYVWTQGCPRRCAGCCNVDALDAGVTGIEMTAEELASICAGEPRGMVLSGGEPFSQAALLARACERVRARVLDMPIIAYTGYTIDELLGVSGGAALLREIDLLIDGPFDAKRLSDSPLIGSTNQRAFFMTRRISREHFAAAGRAQMAVGIGEDGVRLVGAGRIVPQMLRLTGALTSAPLGEDRSTRDTGIRSS
jgi:anaerobic ribonucleoside-triphosphate reductase activating protein